MVIKWLTVYALNGSITCEVYIRAEEIEKMIWCTGRELNPHVISDISPLN